jgi:uncharacterized protein with PQ loop repeat
MVVPQMVRTLRNRDLPGVSALSWGLSAVACSTWLLYGIRSGEVPQIPGNSLMVVGAILIVLAIPSPLSRASRALRLALPIAALVALAFLVPPAVTGFVEAGGVSIASWSLRAASQVLWLSYALASHDLVVTISASVTLVSALLPVVIELRRGSVQLAVAREAREAECVTVG